MPKEQSESLFGLSPEDAQRALVQQQQAQGMQYALNMGPQGNPFYLPGTAANAYSAGVGLGNVGGQLFGAIPPQVAEAYKVQNVMQETESAGIDFDTNPVGYMKVAASNFLKAGMHDKALQVMNQAQEWASKESEQIKNLQPKAGATPSDREQASARIVQWLMRKENGEATHPSEDAQIMADIEMIEPLKFTEGGTQMMDVNALRPRIARALQIKPTVSGTMNEGAAETTGIPEQPRPVPQALGPSKGTYSPTPYEAGGVMHIPDPQRKGRELQEATQAVLNDLRTKPILPVMQAFDKVEQVLSPYLTSGEKIPGLGTAESMLTMGEEGTLKSLGRGAYNIAADMGNENAKRAVDILTALDQLMAIDISKWAGASQTIMESMRQRVSKMLVRGAGERELVNALRDYKDVLESEMATYMGGLDPMIKENLLKDPSYGKYFEKALKPLPFGAVLWKIDSKTGQEVYKTPDGKKWVR